MTTAGTTLLRGRVIGVGVVVALLASAIPYGCELEALPKRKEFIELLSQAKTQEEPKSLLGVDLARERSK